MENNNQPFLKFSDYLSEENIKSRFMQNVKKSENGCWIWKKHVGTDHYGQFWKDGSAKPAHKVAYELFRGKVPAGKLLMHKKGCSRSCCNPAHLTVGTKQTNNDQTARDGHSRNQNTGTLKGSPLNTGDRKPHKN